MRENRHTKRKRKPVRISKSIDKANHDQSSGDVGIVHRLAKVVQGDGAASSDFRQPQKKLFSLGMGVTRPTTPHDAYQMPSVHPPSHFFPHDTGQQQKPEPEYLSTIPSGSSPDPPLAMQARNFEPPGTRFAHILATMSNLVGNTTGLIHNPQWFLHPLLLASNLCHSGALRESCLSMDGRMSHANVEQRKHGEGTSTRLELELARLCRQALDMTSLGRVNMTLPLKLHSILILVSLQALLYLLITPGLTQMPARWCNRLHSQPVMQRPVKQIHRAHTDDSNGKEFDEGYVNWGSSELL
jgi:hypothetical protein